MYGKTVKFEYPLKQVQEPIVTHLVKEFDVAPNILSANIDPSKGGWLIIELLGDESSVEKAIAWTLSKGIVVSDIPTAA
jgi:L-aspartate semialdehyde sulfurtransferase ferredoxin